MRKNLVKMLDETGLPNQLRLDSCERLFGDVRQLLHTTSVVRYTAFVCGKNYSGHSPDMSGPGSSSMTNLPRSELALFFEGVISRMQSRVKGELFSAVAFLLLLNQPHGWERIESAEGYPMAG